MTPKETIDKAATDFAVRARVNLKSWGIQSKETLVLVMQRELGELSEALLEGESHFRLKDECIDLAALCHQFMVTLEHEGEEG